MEFKSMSRLTIHLSLEELDERLCEGLDPFVHDVVALLGRGFLVQECNAVLLWPHANTNTHVNFRLEGAFKLTTQHKHVLNCVSSE